MDNKENYQYIGLVANVLIFISIIFSLIHIVKTQELVSYPMPVLLIKITVNILWILYGYSIGATMTTVMGVILLTYYSFFVYCKACLGW
jgi:uncharacterized membrane protein